MLFRIPVLQDHLRTIKDPVNEAIKIGHALINVNDLSPEIPLDPDPRRPKPTGKVTKKIQTSLATNDGRFHLLNSGITILVEKYEYDNKTGLLKLTIPEDDENYGIIDGGHTHFAICTAIEQEKRRVLKESKTEPATVFDNQFVHLELLEGVEGHRAAIAEARNFSIQLKNWTLANYRNEFDWLLDVLGREDAEQIVRLSENDSQPVGILDIIQVLGATNPSLFKDEMPAREAYKSQGRILTDFIQKDDPADFKSLSAVAVQILELYDHVRLNFKTQYNKNGRFGARIEAEVMAKRRGAKKEAKYWWLARKENRRDKDGKIIPIDGASAPIDKGFAIPLISGFRALLHKVDGQYRWLTDPFEFFDKYGDKLVAPIMVASEDLKREPWSVGRNAQVYQQLTSEVRRWYLEGYVAAAQSSAAKKA